MHLTIIGHVNQPARHRVANLPRRQQGRNPARPFPLMINNLQVDITKKKKKKENGAHTCP